MEYPSLVWHLKKTSLFEDLELEEIERVSESTPYRSFKAGEIVFRMDDPSDALYFVKSGLVKVSKFLPNGKEAILGMVGQYSVFGELLLTPEERRPSQAEALSDTILIVLPRGVLLKLLEQRPAIALKFIQLMAERLFESQSWTAEVSAFSAPERVASLLYRLALEFGTPHSQGVEISVRLNQEDMARMVGATRETVSHCLGRLRDIGALVSSKNPLVVQPEKLLDFLHGQ